MVDSAASLPPPPGPNELSVIDRVRLTFSPPGPVYAEFAAKYGPTFRVRTTDGPTTITGDPEVIRAIYTADPDSFVQRGVELTSPVFGSTSLPVSSGARHKRDRKLVSPAFQAGTTRGYAKAIQDITRSTMAQWSPGQPLAMLDVTQSIALDIIIRVVYGVEDKAEADATRATVLELIHALTPVIFLFPWIRNDFGGFGPWSRLVRAGDALEVTLTDQIRRRRAALAEGNDILSLLVRARDENGEAMTDKEVAEQLRALLFAGHETTATALAMLIDLLHRHPSALERVREELSQLGPEPEPEALASLPFLEATCYETLRLYSPVVEVGRILRVPLTLGPYSFPAGDAIVPSPLLVHRRADLYPEPDRFVPDRFLGKKPSPFEFIAFGGGARRCVGATLAIFEMKLIAGIMLREGYFSPQGKAPGESIRRGLTNGPKGSVPMIFLERRRTGAGKTQA